MTCHRCEGLLVHEPTDFALGEPMVLCVNCGERLSPMILRNRATLSEWRWALLEATSHAAAGQ